MLNMKTIFLVICVSLQSLIFAQNIGDLEIVADWVEVEYDWSEEEKNQAIEDGRFIPENNVITGLKTYQDKIFVTVSRWLPGVPSTMNTLEYRDGRPVMRPYPSWEWQTPDDCSVFQFTQSMEIDVDNNEMWVIDVGRRNIWLDDPINNCPPKIIIFDLTTNQPVHSYVFPDAVLSYSENFVNDIVIDPERGLAYMSDVGVSSGGHPGGVVAYDRKENIARRSEHTSMKPEVNRPDGGYDIIVNGKPYDYTVGSDGISLSTDKRTVHYCSLGGIHLHQVETQELLSCDQDVCQLTDEQVRDLGPKVSESDGIIWGQKSLYFAGLGMNAIFRWDYITDMENQGVSDLKDVNMVSQILVKRDDTDLIWADTFAMDTQGWLWTTANRLPLFANDELDYSGASGPNFRIAKVFVDDVSYLAPPRK